MFNRAITTIPVRDLDAALSFYRDALGFSVVYRVDNRLIHMAAPGMSIALRPVDYPMTNDASPVHIGLIVSDLEETRVQLESRGISFIGESVDLEIAKIAFFNDPDGTPLYIMEWAA